MLNKHEAEKLEKFLRPFYGPIHEAILGGFRNRLTRYSEELLNHTARTRACLTNDLIVVEFIKKELKPLGIRIIKRHGRILFDIQGQVLLHFKKLDRFLQSSNLQTEFAYAFIRQFDLPGIPSTLPRLIAGYIPSPDWTGILSVHITYPVGEEIVWSRSLTEKPEIITNQEEIKHVEKTRTRRFRGRGEAKDTGDGAQRTAGGKH
jgi:hypothetical protein